MIPYKHFQQILREGWLIPESYFFGKFTGEIVFWDDLGLKNSQNKVLKELEELVSLLASNYRVVLKIEYCQPMSSHMQIYEV